MYKRRVEATVEGVWLLENWSSGIPPKLEREHKEIGLERERKTSRLGKSSSSLYTMGRFIIISNKQDIGCYTG